MFEVVYETVMILRLSLRILCKLGCSKFLLGLFVFIGKYFPNGTKI